MTIDLSALERESIRLCRRYIEEVVLPFDLCPWAAPALSQQRVEILALSDRVAPDEPRLDVVVTRAEEALLRLAEAPSSELVLLLFPRFELARRDFDVLLRRLRERPGATSFVMAAFHPEAPLDLTDAERLVPFLRRSPDPMVQAVRRDVLDRIDPARGAGTAFVSLERFLAGDLGKPAAPSPREKVATSNWHTVRQVGPEVLDRVFGALAEDRARAYRALGYAPPRIDR